MVPDVDGAAVGTLSTRVTLTQLSQRFTSITVNGATFSTTKGFPQTGFVGAQFTLNVGTGSASDYNWTSDATWIQVNNGVVSFVSEPSARNHVTITAMPIAGGAPSTYDFTVDKWFIGDDSMGGSVQYFADAENMCDSLGYAMPELSQLTLLTGKRAASGVLWNDWGDVRSYPNNPAWSGKTGMVENEIWTLDDAPFSQKYTFVTSSGSRGIIGLYQGTANTMCVKSL